MRKIATTLLVTLVLVGFGMAYGQNIEFVNSYLWGNVDDIEVSGNYAYCLFANGIEVLNISDPASPQFVSYLYFPNQDGNIKVLGDYLYFAAGLPGLRVIDIRDPLHLSIVGLITICPALDMFCWKLCLSGRRQRWHESAGYEQSSTTHYNGDFSWWMRRSLPMCFRQLCILPLRGRRVESG